MSPNAAGSKRDFGIGTVDPENGKKIVGYAFGGKGIYEGEQHLLNQQLPLKKAQPSQGSK